MTSTRSLIPSLFDSAQMRTGAGDVAYSEFIQAPESPHELDPLPWRHHYDHEDRRETNDEPGSLLDFRPREEFVQGRMRYPLRQRY
jgi:hypothetical protein